MADIYKKIKCKNFETIIVRSCYEEDLEALQIFLQKGAIESNHTLLCKDHDQPFSKLKSRVENALITSSEIYLCVFDEKKIIGQLHFKTLSPDHPWIKHIAEFGMMISADFWGRGIGYALLQMMDEFTEKIGIIKIEAKVRVSNERGLSLYMNNGYSIEGTRKRAAFIDGQFEDEFFIAKFLKTADLK